MKDLKSKVILLGLICAGAVGATRYFRKPESPDDKIKKIMIAENHEAYRLRMQARGNAGTCPCPYSINRAGDSCDESSAYSQPGGETPWCYPNDISQQELDAWKASHVDHP